MLCGSRSPIRPGRASFAMWWCRSGPAWRRCVFFLLFSSSIVEQHGSAVALGNDMYQLTPEQDDKAGNVWGFVDLSDDVVWTTRMFFGSNDNGADGIAFALAPAAMAPQDVGGGSLGVLNPGSIGLKFDTYRNVPHGDPSSDFAQIVLNGDVEASSTGVDGYHLLGQHRGRRVARRHGQVVRRNQDAELFARRARRSDRSLMTSSLIYLTAVLEPGFGFGAATGDHHSDQRVQIVSVATGVGDGIVDIGATEGALVGVLEGSGSDPSDALSYQITDADGVTVVDSLFTIANGRELRVKSGITVTGASGDLHTLHVKVVSASGASLVREISVALRQVGSALDVTSGSTLTSTSGSDLFRVAAGFGFRRHRRVRDERSLARRHRDRQGHIRRLGTSARRHQTVRLRSRDRAQQSGHADIAQCSARELQAS